MFARVHSDDDFTNRGGNTIFSTRWTKPTNTHISVRISERIAMLEHSQFISNSSIYYSFCPRSLILEQLACSDFDGAKTKNYNCCCLIVDISGFTSLSSQLCEQGLAGVDKLRHFLNDSFKNLIRIVYSHDGDVIHFAGDALICIFKQSIHNARDISYCLQDPCRRAVLCAIQLKTVTYRNTSIHIGLSCGNIVFSYLGGFNKIWSYILVGKCMEEVGVCLQDAGPEDVVVTETVYGYLNTSDLSIESKRLKSGNFKIMKANVVITPDACSESNDPNVSNEPTRLGDMVSRQNLTNAQIAGIITYVPRPVLIPISSGLLSDVGELRKITTLFLKIDNFNASECDLNVLQSFYCTTQSIVHEAGGYIRQLLVDDKGCILVVLWGVPTASYPNNCNRSLRCAAKISQSASLPAIGYKCSIGITTGVAYCGCVGSSLRQDFAAIGTSVNFCARLMNKADGRIIIDAETFDSLPLEASKHMKVAETMSLKGLNSHSTCYYYDSTELPQTVVTDAMSTSNVIIEKYMVNGIAHLLTSVSFRHKILNTSLCLHGITPFACKKETFPSFTILRGYPGSGKSTMAMYTFRECKKRAFNTSYVRISATDRDVSLSAIRKILLELIGDGNFLEDKSSQQYVVFTLLRKAFKGESLQYICEHRYPIFKKVLRLSWDMISITDDSNLSSVSDTNGNISNCKVRVTEGTGYRAQSICVNTITLPKILNDELTLSTIISYLLLDKKISCVILDDVHHMCKKSWKIMNMLSKSVINTCFLMSICCEKYSLHEKGNRDESETSCGSNISVMGEDVGTHTSPKRLVDKSLSSLSSRVEIINQKSNDDHWLHDCLNEYNVIADLDTTVVIDIKPLSIDGTSRLICNNIQSKHLLSNGTEVHTTTDPLVALAYKISEGSPFWTWKIIKFINDSGKKDILKTTKLCIDRQALMMCMMEKFTPAEKVIMKYACIIGNTFSLDILERIIPIALLASLEDCLTSLTSGGFIYCLSNTAYCFQSELIRDMVYELIPPSDASSIHLLTAQAIEFAHRDEDITDYLFIITHHYFLSPKSCQPKSLEFSKRSALHCIQNHKYKESMVFISWARSCALNNHELNSVLMIVELVMKELELSMNRENSTAKSIMLHRVNALHKEMLVTYTKRNRRGILVLCGCL